MNSCRNIPHFLRVIESFRGVIERIFKLSKVLRHLSKVVKFQTQFALVNSTFMREKGIQK